MKKASIVMGDSFYNKNRLFDEHDLIANRDNCLLPFRLLKTRLYEFGYDLQTSDMHAPSQSEIVIYNEMPKSLPLGKEVSKSFLLLFESELIRPDNWKIENHKYFKKIFTWNDDLVDNVRYYKINFSFALPERINKSLSVKQKLCTLIAGNKAIDHPLELYSKRIDVIRWFEMKHPDDFDLYGIGWNTYRFSGPRIIRALNKIKPLTRMLASKFPSYKGQIEEKKTVLEAYKFAICFENARDIPGYITEKIFDCFFSGCIPVYWGANNITDHIPADCFIDMREFKSYDQLYKVMSVMSDSEYMQYLDSIECYLGSVASREFSAYNFASDLTSTILHK